MGLGEISNELDNLRGVLQLIVTNIFVIRLRTKHKGINYIFEKLPAKSHAFIASVLKERA
jgi:hypothetical protein